MNGLHSDTLSDLAESLESRKQADAKHSYVAKLFQSGLNKILEKVGEEATEVILAAKDLEQSQDTAKTQALTEALLNEVADLWFHNLVMLAHLNCGPTDVLEILKQRMGRCGLEEKASRSQTKGH